MSVIEPLFTGQLSGQRQVTRLAGGVMLHDVSADLPRNSAKRFRIRKKDPTTLFIHHAGVDNGKDGVEAVRRMASYHVYHKNWAGIGYHYAITKRPLHDDQDNLVVMRVAPESTVRAHTRGCNRFGTGLVLQGHLGEEDLSHFQEECLEAFVPWWMETNNRFCKRGLGWHSNSWKWGGIPKRACPGKHSVGWLEDYRASLPRRVQA
ncbi:MAG: hypothetical protein V3U34_00485 [candidate division NC10 bacterium]